MCLAALSSSYLCRLIPDGLLSWVYYTHLHLKHHFFSSRGFHGLMFGQLLLLEFSVVVWGLGSVCLCMCTRVCSLYLCGVYPPFACSSGEWGLLWSLLWSSTAIVDSVKITGARTREIIQAVSFLLHTLKLGLCIYCLFFAALKLMLHVYMS